MNNFYTEPRHTCPRCLRPPRGWIEAARFKSREMHWVGCHICGIVAGGVSGTVALINWERVVMRWKYEHDAR